MGSDLPEWFWKNARVRGNELAGEIENGEVDVCDLYMEAWKECYEFLSQPNHAAEIECVKPLIDANINYFKRDNCIRCGGDRVGECTCGYVEIIEALKPFKKEGENVES